MPFLTNDARFRVRIVTLYIIAGSVLWGYCGLCTLLSHITIGLLPADTIERTVARIFNVLPPYMYPERAQKRIELGLLGTLYICVWCIYFFFLFRAFQWVFDRWGKYILRRAPTLVTFILWILKVNDEKTERKRVAQMRRLEDTFD